MKQYESLMKAARTLCTVSAFALASGSVLAQSATKSPRATKPATLASLKATARSGTALNPNALGSFSSDLAFTAVTPCRIVDTRNAVGAFTGGQTRTFDLDGLIGAATTYAQQGGIAGSCNIPFGTATAAALNITVTGTASPGYLTAWGLDRTQPNASVLNWSAGATIANTTIVPIVPGAGDDFSIYASTGTQVVIDVVGYFAAPASIQIPAPIRMGSEAGTSESPSSIRSGEPAYAGMVTRRIISFQATAGSIVARTPDMTLERDGTNGGFQVRTAVSLSAVLSVRGTVVHANGTVTGISYETVNQFNGSLGALFSDSDGIIFAHLTFGNFYNGGNITEVTLSRAAASNDPYWSGTVMTSYNQ